ncbi:MAG: ThiF family adenylyltransferase [Rhodocyclaceae bacterium]|nr:ThiF family adenylyltransferase [Rhodocyclaceae bacterium]
MMNKSTLRIARSDYDLLKNHLFPGDRDEHGAILLAGVSATNDKLKLLVREVHFAKEGKDYVPGTVGYRALSPKFIHSLITRARDQRLAYLAVHNHDSDRSVAFSRVDIDSHHRGYPALLQIAKGMPVGALVFGRNSVQADVWLPNGDRLDLDEAAIIGNTVQRLTPAQQTYRLMEFDSYDRQVRMFGPAGQARLALSKVAIVGLGGVGSMLAEYLARLGVGRFVLIDGDRVEQSNLSRIVGASLEDAAHGTPKVEVARRVILQAQPGAETRPIVGDVASQDVAKTLADCDYIFLSADSMRARLVVNAVTHQYLIPGVQVGAKVRTDRGGTLLDVMSANRPMRPGAGCLWCNGLIDPTLLAQEAKTDAERKAQAYGVEEPNPSVISLNAIAAAHATNDFLLDYLGLRSDRDVMFEHFHHLKRDRAIVQPRRDANCPECGRAGRYGRGDAVALPTQST